MLSNKIFDILKWCSILLIPALASLYKGLAVIWQLPYADEIPQTLIVLDTFLGAILGISTIDYNKKNKNIIEEAKTLNAQNQ
jgi:hypothetical protein